jgi:hypothetical protein
MFRVSRSVFSSPSASGPTAKIVLPKAIQASRFGNQNVSPPLGSFDSEQEKFQYLLKDLGELTAEPFSFKQRVVAYLKPKNNKSGYRMDVVSDLYTQLCNKRSMCIRAYRDRDLKTAEKMGFKHDPPLKQAMAERYNTYVMLGEMPENFMNHFRNALLFVQDYNISMSDLTLDRTLYEYEVQQHRTMF